MFVATDHEVVDRIREIVDEAIENAPPLWNSGFLAREVVEKLRVNEPALLAKWLDLQAATFIREMITDVIRHHRHAARLESKARANSVFVNAVERYEAGEDNALGAWLETIYVVNTKNTRKRLADMEQEDLLYAASDYTARARTNQMQAAFLRVLAEKVGAGTVADVFDNDQLSRLWRSLT